MLSLQGIVDAVVKRGAKAPRALVAFVTRMLGYRSGQAEFMSAGVVDTILQYVASDHPSPLTVRMQAVFDSSYYAAHVAVDQRHRARRKRLDELADDVCAMNVESIHDVATLSAVYKKLFAYALIVATPDAGLVVGGGGGPPPSAASPTRASSQASRGRSLSPSRGGTAVSASRGGSRAGSPLPGGFGSGGLAASMPAHSDAVQKEVAAAMESVFPRVGLRQFAAAAPGDKRAQMEELGLLVLGIRLFNWSHGKGGAGIEDAPERAAQAAAALRSEIEGEITSTNDLIAQYVDILSAVAVGALSVPAASGGGESWPSELTNRRQLCTYLSSLLDELRAHEAALNEAHGAARAELAALAELVGSRASVAKEAVYPRFHNIASRWLAAVDAAAALDAVAESHRALGSFLPTTLSTISIDALRAARQAIAAGVVSPLVALPSPELLGAATGAEEGTVESERGDILSLQESPEVLQLPLELQGYCPVSLCTPAVPSAASGPAGVIGSLTDLRLGILVAGDPSKGIVRFRGRYMVCANAEATAACAAHPAFYLSRVHIMARQHLELVHLLQLLGGSTGFPEASLPVLIQYDGDLGAAAAAVAASLRGGVPASLDAAAESSLVSDGAAAVANVRLSRTGAKLQDASTSTPVHFLDKHVDPHYEWNEWALRRQALRIIQLRQSATTSAQTDASHFRRDNDAQVFLPRDGTTQTGISVASNTTRVVRYFAGLRGEPNPAVDAFAAAAAARNGLLLPGHQPPPKPSAPPSPAISGAAVTGNDKSRGPRVVTMTLEM